MTNMNYCRFENTSRDLRDCLTAIENREKDLSNNEAKAMRSMIERFVCFLNQESLLDIDGEVDQEQLDEIIKEMKEEED